MAQRLPVPGGDDGSWGDILNSYLEVAHNNDGTLKPSSVASAGAEQSSNKAQPSGYASLDSSGLVPKSQLGTGSSSSSNYLRGDGTWAVPAGGGSSTLAADTDVTISSPANNQVLTYSTGSSKWVNQNITLPSTVVTSTTQQLTVSGTPSTGQVLTATGATAANWATSSISLAQLAAAQPFIVDLPENHGAVRNGATDDTAAIKAAITSAVTAGQTNGTNYAEVWFSAGVYLTSAATTQSSTYKGNAQIPLPIIPVSGSKFTLVLRGVGAADAMMHWQQTTSQVSGAVIKSTLAGTNDSTWGEATVIGGPNPKGGYGAQFSVFSNMLIVVDGLELLLPNDPHICGFDFRGVAQAKVVNAAVMPTLTSGPPSTQIIPASQGWQFGLYMPQANNNDLCEIGSFSAYGQNYACVISEHTIADAIRTIYCIAGLVVAGGGGSNTPHRSLVKHVSIEACQIAIMGNYDTGSPTKVDILQVDFEGAGGNWAAFHNIHDPNNNLQGNINWGTNGNSTNTPDVNGGNGLRIIFLEANPGAVASPSLPASTTALKNPFWRDAAVNITGGTVTSIAVDSTATGLTSGTVIVPTGKTITLTYSVAPSWNWLLL